MRTMRRKLALLLSLVMLIGLLPARARAADEMDITDTGLAVWTGRNGSDGPTPSGTYKAGSGTLGWDLNTLTITLTNATINATNSTYGNALDILKPSDSSPEVNVVLNGTNTITGKPFGTTCGIRSQVSLRISGSGTLTVTAGNAASGSSIGIDCSNLAVEKGATVRASAGTAAVQSAGVDLSGILTVAGTLEAIAKTGNSSLGIHAEHDIVVEEGGTLTARGSTTGYGMAFNGNKVSVIVKGTLTAIGSVPFGNGTVEYQNKVIVKRSTSEDGTNLEICATNPVSFPSDSYPDTKYIIMTPDTLEEIGPNLFSVKDEAGKVLDFFTTEPAVLGAYKAEPYGLSVELKGCTEDEIGKVSLVITPTGGETANAANEAKDAGDYKVSVEVTGGTKYAGNTGNPLGLGTVRIEKAQVTLSGFVVPDVLAGSSTTTVDLDVSKAAVVDKDGKTIDGLTITAGTVTGTYADVSKEGVVAVTVDVSRVTLSDDKNYKLVAPDGVTGQVVGKKTLTEKDFAFNAELEDVDGNTVIRSYFSPSTADTPAELNNVFMSSIGYAEGGPDINTAGKITHLTYVGSDGKTYTDAYPMNAGTYRLKVATEGGTDYAAAVDLEIGTLVIQPMPVEITLKGNLTLTQEYDGTITVSAANIQAIKGALVVTDTDDNPVEGLAVDSTKAAFRLASKNAGANNVFVSGLRLAPDAPNYELVAGTEGTFPVEITPKSVTLTASVPQGLVYVPGMIKTDGFADLSSYYLSADDTVKNITVAGVVSGDEVQVRLGTDGKIGAADAAIGAPVNVTFEGLVLGGDDQKNYEISQQPDAVTATIQKATLENVTEPQKMLSTKDIASDGTLTTTYSLADLLPKDDAQLASAKIEFVGQTAAGLGTVTGKKVEETSGPAVELTFAEPTAGKNYKGTITVSGLTYYNDFTVSLDYKLTDQAVAVVTEAEYAAVYSGEPVAVAADGKSIEGLTLAFNPAEAKVAAMTIVGTAPVLHVADSGKASAFVIHVTFEEDAYAEMDIPVKAVIAPDKAPAGLTIKAVPAEVKSFFDTTVELEITTPGLAGEEIILTTSSNKALTPVKSGSVYKVSDVVRLTDMPGTDKNGEMVEIAPIAYKVSWSHPDYEDTWKEVEVPITKSVPFLKITPEGTGNGKDTYAGGTRLTLAIDCASEEDVKRMEICVVSGAITLVKAADGTYTTTLPNTKTAYTFGIYADGVPVNEEGAYRQVLVERAAVVPVESVTVTPASASVKVGETVTLTATVLPSAAGHQVEWISSDIGVAKVSVDGVVTGVKAGTATITASADGKSSACTVTVTSDGGSSSGGSSGGGGGGSSSTPGTTTTTRPDGTKVETTTNADGSKEVVETKKDGTVITTETDKAGNKVETTKNTDGSVKEVVTNKDGSSATVTTDAGGNVEAAVTVKPSQGAAVAPISPVRVGDNEVSVTIQTGTSGSTKVEVPVSNISAGVVAVRVKADGTEEIIMAAVPTETGIAVPVQNGETVKLENRAKAFDDMGSAAWAQSSVDFVSARGMFSGTSDSTFSPGNNLTRAQMVTVLARYHGVDTDGGGTWYEKGVEWAKGVGVSDGTNPEDQINREQMVTMLWRVAGSPETADLAELSAFGDGDAVSDYAQLAMAWAVENGIITGVSGDAISPKGTATRAQVAAVLARYVQNIEANR